MKLLPKALLGLLLLSFTWNISQADMLTSEVIFGSGNTNENFTVSRSNGIEIGMRAKTRYPTPSNSDQSGSLGYSLNEGDYYFANPTDASQPLRGSWNLDWSVNSDYLGTSGDVLSAYDYELAISFAPESGMGAAPSIDFDPLFPINDNWYGTNSTPNGGGQVGNKSPFAFALDDLNNVAQNSTNVGFFGFFPNPADVSTPGIYTIVLSVLENDVVLASNQINVYAGVNPPVAVPEPTSMAIFGLGALGLIGGAARKRMKRNRESSPA